MRRTPVVALALVPCLLLLNRHSFARELTFEDRVKAQEAIERVYWEHRTWPTENRGPKPPLESVLSGTQIRARVEDYLRKSNALAEIWSRPITVEMLQAEMERIAARTRAPEMLREIFAALGNDPLLIAETLVRQTLADRLIRSAYAWDKRLHGELRRQAETSLAGVSSAAQLKSLAVRYAETTFRLKRGDETPVEQASDEIVLGREGFEARLKSLPATPVSRLQEDERAFLATAVVREGAGTVTTATVLWMKTPFDSWWTSRSASVSGEPAHEDGDFARVEVGAGSSCEPDTWTDLPGPVWAGVPGAPGARHGYSKVWTGTEMIVWGGYTFDASRSPQFIYLDSGARYDPSTDSWAATSTRGAPAGRSSHSAVWAGGEMIVWGGSDGSESLDTGGRYDPFTDSWTATATAGAPGARAGHTAVWTGREMIVWGGFVRTGDVNTYLNDGGRYNPATQGWAATSLIGTPGKRSSHGAVWTGNEMIVWGGLDWPFWRPANSGGRYSPATDSWTATTTRGAPVLGMGHSTVWTGREMIVWGGIDDTHAEPWYHASGGRYNPSTDSWGYIGGWGGQGRYSHSAVWTGRVMIVWGGVCGWSRCSDGARYDPSTNMWLAVTGSGAPVGGPETAVWTGREMIVWDGSGYNDGARYDPGTDSWTSIAGGNVAMISRMGHTAVWTGSEMIVWGGDNYGPLNDGARYDPATDTWLATSSAGAPGARKFHGAVWTGREMIVWGGDNRDTALSDGGRYDPSTDTWVATTHAGAPRPRAAHAAVWTGREMIVWGGYTRTYTQSIYLMVTGGGRYDPATDSWARTSTTGTPDGGPWPAAAWTGSDMIVWQRSAAVSNLSEGWRYEPSTDTWAAISTSGAPSLRIFPLSVWTGREMLVWGGTNDNGGALNDGGRYDPATDMWVAITMNGAPPASSQSSAIWTGAEMIVWGGFVRDGGSYYGGGGARYSPSGDTWAAIASDGAPSRRGGHAAVWTGNEMIVWGGMGDAPGADGGRYCVLKCASPIPWYRDSDGDGHGSADDPQVACDHPDGFVGAPGDCDDTNAAIHPGANESCDGLDDDCNGVVDDQPVSDLSCDDANECTIDACRSGACARSAAIIPEAACSAEPSVLNLGSNGRTFGLTVTVTDRCSGQALDPMGLAPLYLSAVESPTLGRVVLPTPDSGPGCTQDGIWETVAQRQTTAPGTMTTHFQAPSDGLCGTLDGNRQDIAGLLVNAREAETAEISFAASYPGAADGMRCAAAVEVRGVMKGKGRPTP